MESAIAPFSMTDTPQKIRCWSAIIHPNLEHPKTWLSRQQVAIALTPDEQN
jgi:hypothetical protein